MEKTRVKIIRDRAYVDDQINDWISEHENSVRIKDIKFAATHSEDNGKDYCYAMIIYEESDE